MITLFHWASIGLVLRNLSWGVSKFCSVRRHSFASVSVTGFLFFHFAWHWMRAKGRDLIISWPDSLRFSLSRLNYILWLWYYEPVWFLEVCYHMCPEVTTVMLWIYRHKLSVSTLYLRSSQPVLHSRVHCCWCLMVSMVLLPINLGIRWEFMVRSAQ